MNESFYYFGLYLIFPTALLLAAGLGWKKAASGLTLAFVIATLGAVFVAFVASAMASPFDRGGEWRGLTTLAFGVLGFFGGFIVSIIVALVWLVKKKRLSTERASKSPELLGAAGVGFAIVLFCLGNVFIGSTPAAASTQRLVEQVDSSNDTPGSRAEIVRRGQEAVPFIIAVLHRYPYAQKDDRSMLGSIRVAPQLNRRASRKQIPISKTLSSSLSAGFAT